MDPFVEVKRDVETSLKKALDLSRTSQQNPFATEQLNNIISSIEQDLQDLDETIRITEANPARFNLHPSEVAGRKEFVRETRRRIKDLKAGGGASTAEDATRNALFASRTSSNAPLNNPFEQSNAKFLENEQMQQTMLMKSQDQQMNGVLSTVVNLKEVAHVMGREMDDQSRLLDEMDVQVDTTSAKLGHGMKKMNEFLKANSSSKQQITIVCLIVALIVLLILIFTV